MTTAQQEPPPHILDAGTFPLHGSRLIEASAGTGKTWTIAALYLRLVLGHGQADTAFLRPLLPAEILVMTFTRAATKELSDRIRARLIEAARCFREPDAAPQDALLADLLTAYPEPSARNQAAWRLAMAAEAMDEAAVLTIDAWCQRMLREHAFDSGHPFHETLSTDEASLLTEAAQDYWRQQCYPLPDAALEVVLAVWPGVDALIEEMKSLAGRAGDDDTLYTSLAECIEAQCAQRAHELLALSAGWDARAQAMQGWLDAQLALTTCPWNRSKLHSRYYNGWFAALQAWAQDPLGKALDLNDTARFRLTPQGLRDALKPGASEPALPDDFFAFARLIAAYGALPDPRIAVRLHASTHVGRRLALLKRQARSFGFSDLLARLDAALSGPRGARLRARILTQYPVALIDEFQDTSPLQYRLFDTLYRSADNSPDHALLLIGDPKQSIYGFRGADIYSYLQARRATTGRHYVLDTNYRSTGPMVAAINHWFEQAESRADHPAISGAFLFREPSDNPLPFVPARAHGREEVFQCAAGPVPALTIEHDLEFCSMGDSQQRFAARCAEQIVTWLNDEQAGFRHPRHGFKRLRPADVAVLVRTGGEAAAVRRELRRRGIASVYLSDKDSVFASDEAHDLLHWLRAAANPLDAQRLRAALATRMADRSMEELLELASDDEAFDARSEQMRQLHRVWRDLGVLTMLRHSLHLLDLPARWLRQADGERRLTNYLHLAELLQHASAQLDGEQALIRWLANQIETAANGQEEQIVRLESDADLITVVTIHKSKGLEYPLVCLPFACKFRPVERRNTPYLNTVTPSGTRRLKLDLDDTDLVWAERERLREDLRLFYVALTRARHAVWMGFATVRVGTSKACVTQHSAPGYLLGGGAELDKQGWLAALEALAHSAQQGVSCDSAVIALQAAPDDIACSHVRLREAAPELAQSLVYAAQFERYWSLGSFSALTRGMEANQSSSTLAAQSQAQGQTNVQPMTSDRLSPMQMRLPAEDEALPQSGVFMALGAATAHTHSHTAAPAPWHRYPGGSLTGNFLHEQLQWLASEGFALAGDPRRESALRQRCERAGRSEYVDDTIAWLQTVITTPLPGMGAALQDLRVHCAEMEFWMPAGRLQAADVDALCGAHLLQRRPRPALAQRTLHGMLMGFIDLVFEHQGRFWILDYKSNRLGERAEDYHLAALEGAMASHRYDVQAALYLLALHRLLKARLGARYDPARQLGGACYLFLRGIDGPCRGEYLIATTPEIHALIDTLDQLLADEAGQA